MATRRSPRTRFVLGAAAALTLAAPSIFSGCAAGFTPISQIDGLRVLSVVTERLGVPEGTSDVYAAPGDQVRLTMKHVDSEKRPINVVWLGGCFDPEGDQYFACYQSFQSLFQGGFDINAALATGYVGIGDTFTITLPDDIISRRPRPPEGSPYYGVAYVFFLACAGTLKPVPPEGTGLAGSFPIGCFNAAGERLGAESFVPGYTQIYAFDDGRSNENPVIQDLALGGVVLQDDPQNPYVVPRCEVSEEDRLGPRGCGKKDVASLCEQFDLSVVVDSDVAEIDPTGKQADGSPLREVVWVDYFVEKGNLGGDAKLITDAVDGYRPDHSVVLTPPAEPGPYRIWAVVHDARGGQAVIERWLDVK